MKIDEEQIFVLTNPIFWLWFIVMLVFTLLKKFLDVTGIYDWFYVLITFDKMSESGKDQMIIVMNNQPKMLWLKRKAWEYAVTKIEKQRVD
jgi:hypothetical protein